MTARPKTDPIHYGTASLKARGWTDGLIRKFLGEPDLLAPNPHYRSAPPWKLYLIARVEAIEQSDAFQLAALRARPRRRGAAQAVETKRDAMRRHVARLDYAVPAMDREQLVRQACAAYNGRIARRSERRRWADEGVEYRPATPESAPRFLERLCVNFLRHELTKYDHDLDDLIGKVGVGLAYPIIAAKVFDAIAVAYPWLQAECERQKQERVGEESKP